jgi:heterodisulfide reductase subunit B
MREKEYGIWQSLSWSDLAIMVQQLAGGLHQAGLRRGECSESGEREKLLEVMQKSVGLVEVNKRVGHGLSGWLCEFYGKEYERRKRDLGEENEETRKAEAILKALDESR